METKTKTASCRRWALCLIFGVSCFATQQSALALTYVLTDLGENGAVGINNYGQVLFRTSPTLLWTPSVRNGTSGAFTDIGGSSAVALNDLGQVLGEQGWLWTPAVPNGTNGATVSLGNTYCLGLNNVGTVVGSLLEPPLCAECLPIPTPARWANGRWHKLDQDQGFATAVNDAGEIVGRLNLLVLWQGGSATPLSPEPGGWPYGINAFGQVVGFSGANRAFLWTPGTRNGKSGTMTDLGYGYASGLNNSGQVVGNVEDQPGLYPPFLWTPTIPNGTNGTMTSLNGLVPAGSGWVLQNPTGINDIGQITGYGLQPDGTTHSFLLTPVPSARLGYPVLQPDGRLSFTLVGDAGHRYTIEASTNLLHWIALTNFISANGTNEFTDAATPGFNRRFYRAVTQ